MDTLGETRIRELLKWHYLNPTLYLQSNEAMEKFNYTSSSNASGTSVTSGNKKTNNNNNHHHQDSKNSNSASGTTDRGGGGGSTRVSARVKKRKALNMVFAGDDEDSDEVTADLEAVDAYIREEEVCIYIYMYVCMCMYPGIIMSIIAI